MTRTRVQLISVFWSAVSVVQYANAFDFFDLSANWPCSQEGDLKGNFPQDLWYDDETNRAIRLAVPPDQWTTFPVPHAKTHIDTKDQMLVRPWSNISEPVAFYVTPRGYGRENRIVVQMALSASHPTEPPFPLAKEAVRLFENEPIGLRQHKDFNEMWELMKRGLFNCHINRHLNMHGVTTRSNDKDIYETRARRLELWALVEANRKEHGECGRQIIKFEGYRTYCQVWEDLLQDNEYGDFYEVTPCGAMVDHPLCCYATWDSREQIRRRMGKDQYDWNEGEQCKNQVN